MMHSISLYMVVILCFLGNPKNGVCTDMYTAAFLEIGIDARQSAMGGAGGTIAGTPSSFYWNPAGIAFSKKPTLQFMHNWMYEGFTTHDYLGASYMLKDKTVLAINAIIQSIPDVPVFAKLEDYGITNDIDLEEYLLKNQGDNTPPGGYFTAYDAAVFISFAKVFRKQFDLGWQYFIIPVEIPVGMNFKFIKQELGNYGTGWGTGVDAGMLLRIDARRLLGERDFLGYFDIGLNLQDVGGTVITWDSQHASILLFNTKLSCGYEQPLQKYSSVFRICYDYDVRYSTPHIGSELTYRNTIALRCGYNAESLTIGAGLRALGGFFDYTFDFQEFGNIHRISGGYRFGKEK